MMIWTDKEKAVLLKENTSSEAIKKYYEKFPQSERNKSSLYTYWWWRKQEEKKKFEESLPEPVQKIVRSTINIVTKAVVEKVKKDIEQVHASITECIAVGDMVKFSRTPDAPVGTVISMEAKRNMPAMSQRMKVRFGNYYVRDVYVCDYKIVSKAIK